MNYLVQVTRENKPDYVHDYEVTVTAENKIIAIKRAMDALLGVDGEPGFLIEAKGDLIIKCRQVKAL